jgi:AcrR family transcriptional regulator
MDVSSPEKTDGRQLRRERNREAVVDALLDLYRDGNLRPSTEEIAARSGLSPRSLFRYFDDVDDLTRTAILRIERQAADLLPIDVKPTAALDVRAKALVDQRFRLFDTVGSAAAVSRLRSPFQPILADRLRRNRSLLRSQIKSLFEPELNVMDKKEAGMALAAADVLTSFESHQLLVKDQELPAGQAGAAMVSALVTLLGTRPLTRPV